MKREIGLLERDDRGMPLPPSPMPEDPEELLELMDDASQIASQGGGATAPKFDHAMRIFQQVSARFQFVVTRDLGRAHQDLRSATTNLESATKALKAATWLLVAVTAVLVILEAVKLLIGH